MDYIPTIHFISAIVLFGLFFYVYDPIVQGFFGLTPTSGDYSQAMFFLWMILPAINLFISGIRFIMTMQEETA